MNDVDDGGSFVAHMGGSDTWELCAGIGVALLRSTWGESLPSSKLMKDGGVLGSIFQMKLPPTNFKLIILITASSNIFILNLVYV